MRIGALVQVTGPLRFRGRWRPLSFSVTSDSRSHGCENLPEAGGSGIGKLKVLEELRPVALACCQWGSLSAGWNVGRRMVLGRRANGAKSKGQHRAHGAGCFVCAAPARHTLLATSARRQGSLRRLTRRWRYNLPFYSNEEMRPFRFLTLISIKRCLPASSLSTLFPHIAGKRDY